jgi:phosphoribosyl-AMP cyclohydrolase / phosphoribosyl-ATP pyrophosphohydrolase
MEVRKTFKVEFLKVFSVRFRIAVLTPRAVPIPTKLFEGGQDKILKKVAEEAGEVLLASKGSKKEEIVYEVADLFFHTLMVLGYHDLSLQDIYGELGRRFGRSGLRMEK